MKHTGSTLVILLFLGLTYFIFPHSLLPQKVSANGIHQKVSLPFVLPTVSPLPKTTRKKAMQLLLPHVQVPNTSTPTPMPISTLTPIQTHVMAPSSAPQQDTIQAFILSQVNEYRKSQGLSEVSPIALVCDFANKRSKEIVSSFSHDEFTARISKKTLPYATYTLVTENIAQNPNYQDVVALWKKSSGHATNMRSDTPYVCVGHSGNFYAYEGWRP